MRNGSSAYLFRISDYIAARMLFSAIMDEGETLRRVNDVPEGGLTTMVISCRGTSGALGLIRMMNGSASPRWLLGWGRGRGGPED